MSTAGNASGRGLSRLASPSLAVAFATLFWGTAWYPMRLLKERGLDADWAIVAIFAVVALSLTPFVIAARGRIAGHWRSFALAGLTGGVAMTCYYLSVTQTTIARATLLFYLAPAWTTLIELVVLKQRLHPSRFLEIGLGLFGLAAILGPTGGDWAAANVGDVLAAIAGVTFAVSTYYVYSEPQPGARGFTWAWAVGSVASAGLAGLLFNLDGLDRAVETPGLALPVLAIALVMFMPMNVLTLWGARQLSPTRVALLLMCEVAVAFASSAILAEEPFGLREAAGCALVLSASLVAPVRAWFALSRGSA